MSSSNESTIASLVQQLADVLLAKKLILSTAESCTGGGISAALTDLAGSSGWFDTGFITYSNEAKQRLLDVPAQVLGYEGPGAVSEETVRAMTAGAISHSRANLAVAVSGVAGPDGGSADKPVGTVWVAWQWQDKALARRFNFSGDRAAVRTATIIAGLEGLLVLVA